MKPSQEQIACTVPNTVFLLGNVNILVIVLSLLIGKDKFPSVMRVEEKAFFAKKSYILRKIKVWVFHLIDVSSLFGCSALWPVLKFLCACQIVRTCFSFLFTLPFFSDYRGFLLAFPLLLTTPSDVATPAGQRRRCNAIKSNPIGKHFHFRKAKTQLLIRKLKCQVQEGNS